ncbi:MAG: hypothetical protein IJZ68_08585 [Bacteroidaceae bacterium]|nr:hypothetical protein [Bacteroidaceae bacterium]
MPEYLSRVEMMVALTSKPHVKISHRFFTKDEYIYLGDDGKVYDENGYLFDDWDSPANCGLRMRTGGNWESGWYIKNPAA